MFCGLLSLGWVVGLLTTAHADWQPRVGTPQGFCELDHTGKSPAAPLTN